MLPVLTLALLPLLYALNPLAAKAGQGRYALFAVPMAALLMGCGLAHAPDIRPGWGDLRPGLVWTAGLACLCALGAAGLHGEPRSLVAFPAPDVAMPTDDSALQALLARHDVTDAYAPYWIAYRVMFETGGRTKVAPYSNDRYPPIAAAVQASPIPCICSSPRPGPSARSRPGAASTTSIARNGGRALSPSSSRPPTSAPASCRARC